MSFILQGPQFFPPTFLRALEILPPHEHISPISMRLEASKKVLLAHVAQGAAKLQVVKVKNLEKSSFCLVAVNTETLSSCNFAAP